MTESDWLDFLGLSFMTGIVCWISFYHIRELDKDVKESNERERQQELREKNLKPQA
ncbi:MAG: hypothetical protein MK033_10575 [Candidatus Caenarcaniphilales bacterium]|nr:hypothetical protein [Candidatus Caenarcaniphilales bacterium]